jgi:Na+-driven multidrug efflux pump
MISSNVGSVGLQIFSIYSNSLFLVYIIFIGTAQTLSPIVSVYAHEGDYDRARYVLKRSLMTAIGGAVGVGLLFAVFPQIILFLYGIKDPGVIMACQDGIRLYVFSYPGLAFFYIMSYYFQAIKKQRLAAVMTALEGLSRGLYGCPGTTVQDDGRMGYLF